MHTPSTAAIEHELRRRHARRRGSKLRLDPPVSFNEHIIHRIIHDRDPRLKTVCDKLAVRELIRQRLGERYVVPLLGLWDSARDIDWRRMPRRFIVKPSHASGAVVLVCPPLCPPPPEDVLERWLAWDYAKATFEWGYAGLPRRILAEPLLVGPHGGQPLEVQVQVVRGRTIQIGLITGFKGTASRYGDWFYADGRRHPGRRREPLRHGPLPAYVRTEIVPLAEHIARDFAQMRVDFYVTHEGLKIGELTPYSGGGWSNFDPPELDEEMGGLWSATAALFG